MSFKFLGTYLNKILEQILLKYIQKYLFLSWKSGEFYYFLPTTGMNASFCQPQKSKFLIGFSKSVHAFREHRLSLENLLKKWFLFSQRSDLLL